MKHLDKIEHSSGSIIVILREWEGIGTPDYYTLDFTIEKAIWARDKFSEAIDQAKEYNKSSKESRIQALKSEIQARQDELSNLTKE